jgi:hypothetical protein
VADGLIILHLELNAKDYINSIGNQCKYEESPYMTINRNQRKKANELGKAQRKAAFEIRRISLHEADEEPEEELPARNAFKGGLNVTIPTAQPTLGRFLRDHLDPQFDVQQFEKRHAFKVHNYMGLPFCDFCGNFMWGILGQGVKCEGQSRSSLFSLESTQLNTNHAPFPYASPRLWIQCSQEMLGKSAQRLLSRFEICSKNLRH